MIQKKFGLINFYSSLILLLIWALPETIALRHLCLLIGFFFGSLYIWGNKGKFWTRSAVPLAIYLLLFIWILTHYFLFTSNKELQLFELKSLWLRVIAGSVMAIALVIFLQEEIHKRQLFISSVFSISVFTVLFYFYGCYKSQHFITPNDFVGLFLINKVNAAFMAVIGVSVSCANLLWNIRTLNDPLNNSKYKLAIFGVVISIFSAVVASSKNGVAISLFLILLSVVYLMLNIFSQRKIVIKEMITLVILVTVIIFALKLHSKFASPGWADLVEDIKISVQIEKYQNWKDTPSLGFPTKLDGRIVAGNTYERFAWATKGIELIGKYPLGYGLINHSSFRSLLIRDGVDYKQTNLTHSGWIDLGLAFGMPALMIVFSSLISVIILALRSTNYLSLNGLWLSIGIILACCVEEVAFKHTFEIWMFFVAFSCASVIKPKLNEVSV